MSNILEVVYLLVTFYKKSKNFGMVVCGKLLHAANDYCGSYFQSLQLLIQF